MTLHLPQLLASADAAAISKGALAADILALKERIAADQAELAALEGKVASADADIETAVSSLVEAGVDRAAALKLIEDRLEALTKLGILPGAAALASEDKVATRRQRRSSRKDASPPSGDAPQTNVPPQGTSTAPPPSVSPPAPEAVVTPPAQSGELQQTAVQEPANPEGGEPVTTVPPTAPQPQVTSPEITATDTIKDPVVSQEPAPSVEPAAAPHQPEGTVSSEADRFLEEGGEEDPSKTVIWGETDIQPVNGNVSGADVTPAVSPEARAARPAAIVAEDDDMPDFLKA